MPYDFICDIAVTFFFPLCTYFLSLSSQSRSHAFSIRVADTVRQFRPIEPVTTRDAGDRFRENITTSFLCHPNPIVRSLLYRAIHSRPTSNRGYPQEIENPPFTFISRKIIRSKSVTLHFTKLYKLFPNLISSKSFTFLIIQISFPNTFRSHFPTTSSHKRFSFSAAI